MNQRDIAIEAEHIDTCNWLDQFAAAPPHVTAALGLASQWQSQLAMVRSQIPFSHFNMVLTLGCPSAVNDVAFEAIERFYAEGGCGKHWILVNDQSEPSNLGTQLLARGYQNAGTWDRIILRGLQPGLWAQYAQGCELVTPENAEDWSSFIRNCYSMPPIIGDWLHALVGRKRWFHALRRQGGEANAKVVMVRSLYLADNGWSWLGIDAPIPGVMAPCFDDDQKVTATLLMAAMQAGAHSFVSDIEISSATQEGPAYQRWGELGFSFAYLRTLFSKG